MPLLQSNYGSEWARVAINFLLVSKVKKKSE